MGQGDTGTADPEVRAFFVVEEWRDEAGERMLIFVEGPPAPRSDPLEAFLGRAEATLFGAPLARQPF